MSILTVICLLFLTVCDGNGNKTNNTEVTGKSVNVPAFEADSAYIYIQKQNIIPHSDYFSFAPTLHTVNDNMDAIDKLTLKAVGQTVLEVIYNEK